MAGYEQFVSPLTATVNSDGSIAFTPPAPVVPTPEDQLAAIDVKYQKKFQELKDTFTSAMIIGGAPMETNVALLRTKWAALIAAQQAEIDTVFSQE